MTQHLIPRSPETPPDISSSSAEYANAIDQNWGHPDMALYQDLSTIFLGTRYENGRPKYHDNRDIMIPLAGLVVRYTQSSAGYTGIEAQGLEGNSVAALNIDASGPNTLWTKPEENGNGRVTLTSNYGNMGRASALKIEDWAQQNFGNPGAQLGIVRVTDATERRRYFAVGADFQGKPDNWRVSGRVLEVFPNFDEGALALAATRKMLAVSTSAAETSEKPNVRVDADVVAAFKDAFCHATPDVFILHAPEGTAERAKMLTSVGVGLMKAMTERQPSIFNGLEKDLDELGRRARLVGGQEKRDVTSGTFIDSLRDPLGARVTYLENIKHMIDTSIPRDDVAHKFSFFAEQLFSILEQSIADKNVMLDASNASMQMLEHLLKTDREQGDDAVKRRAEILRGTLMDPECANDVAQEHHLAVSDTVSIDLNATPLLNPNQTYEAFYERGRTDSLGLSSRERGYGQSTVAVLTVEGRGYALIDTREAGGFIGSYLISKTGNHYSKGEDKARPPVMLLQLSGKIDPMYGESVTQWAYNFSRPFDAKTQKVMDTSEPPTQPYGAYGTRGVELEMPNDHTVLIRSTTEPVTVRTAQ